MGTRGCPDVCAWKVGYDPEEAPFSCPSSAREGRQEPDPPQVQGGTGTQTINRTSTARPRVDIEGSPCGSIPVPTEVHGESDPRQGQGDKQEHRLTESIFLTKAGADEALSGSMFCFGDIPDSGTFDLALQ